MFKRDGNNLIHMAKPTMFQLTTNYRSHGGIVNCANTITQLIYRFWPYRIDKLERESGIVDGAKPIFFAGLGRDNVRCEQFLFGDRPVANVSPDGDGLMTLPSSATVLLNSVQGNVRPFLNYKLASTDTLIVRYHCKKRSFSEVARGANRENRANFVRESPLSTLIISLCGLERFTKARDWSSMTWVFDSEIDLGADNNICSGSSLQFL